mgnify:CR=1 FL=1
MWTLVPGGATPPRTGIASLRIEGVYQLDHLQYGSAIPEPSAWMLHVGGFVLLMLRRSR